ncbi:hypothetical protein [Alistipes indistinctus]|uniref:hypothetical protein n=1 Tax=Alistipes indistinctus TaxID=626932 RepID=UPI00319E4A27
MADHHRDGGDRNLRSGPEHGRVLVLSCADRGDCVGRVKQTSGKEYKDKNGNYTEPEFWKDFVSVMAGALVMWAIVMIG